MVKKAMPWIRLQHCRRKEEGGGRREEGGGNARHGGHACNPCHVVCRNRED
jgi:hypothetical protein